MIGTLLKVGGYYLLARETVDLVVASQRYHRRERRKRQMQHLLSGSLIGAAVGVGTGLLVAPRFGKNTRELVTETANNHLKILKDDLESMKNQPGSDSKGEQKRSSGQGSPQKLT